MVIYCKNLRGALNEHDSLFWKAHDEAWMTGPEGNGFRGTLAGVCRRRKESHEPAEHVATIRSVGSMDGQGWTRSSSTAARRGAYRCKRGGTIFSATNDIAPYHLHKPHALVVTVVALPGAGDCRRLRAGRADSGGSAAAGRAVSTTRDRAPIRAVLVYGGVRPGSGRTPAQAAGLTGHRWTIHGLATFLEPLPQVKPRGRPPHRFRQVARAA